MKETVLITGGTSGIGLALAKRFAAHGYELVLVARKQEELNATKAAIENEFNVRVHSISSDLSDMKAAGKLFDTVQKEKIAIDILVNNAGFGLYGWFKDTDLVKEQMMIDLNVRSLTTLTKLFLPHMLEQKRGKILNIASTAAFQPGPHMAVYYATKAYVLSFSDAIANELKGTGVTVTALCPGPTRTGFSAGAAMEKAKVFTVLQKDNVDEVARVGYEALMKGRTSIIPGGRNRLLSFMTRFGPRDLVTAISRKTLE